MYGRHRWFVAGAGAMLVAGAFAETSEDRNVLWVQAWRRGTEPLTDEGLADRIDPTTNHVYRNSSGTFTLTPPAGEKAVRYWYSATPKDVYPGNAAPSGTSVSCDGKTSFVWDWRSSTNTQYYLAVDFDYITYTVNYTSNGGSGTAPNSEKYVYTNQFTLAANPFTRTGHTFDGWECSAWSDPRAAGTVVSGADFKLDNHDDKAIVELKAHWRAHTYQLQFNAYGGEGTMENQTLTYGEYAQISLCLFTRTGWTFDGWATTAGGGRSYSDQATVRNLTNEDNKVIPLYARWTANEYTIQYQSGAEDATGSMSDQRCTYDQSSTLYNNRFARTGWTFAGWRDAQGREYADGATVSNLTTVAGDVVTLTAQWQAQTWEVFFYRDPAGQEQVGEQWSVDTDGEMPELDSAIYDLNDPMAAVVFGGYADSGGTLFYDANLERQQTVLPAAANLKLFAVWTPAKRYLAFDGNGAESGEMPEPVEFSGAATNTLPANVFLRTGYGFQGWALESAATGTRFADEAQVGWDDLGVAHGATQTVYAVWQPVVYMIEFASSRQDVTLEMPATNVAYDAEVQLPECVFTDSSGIWHFDHWLAADGQTYAAGATVLNLASVADTVVTLTAVFARDATEFSRAMEIDNLFWVREAGDNWGVREASGAGDGNDTALTNTVAIVKEGDSSSIVPSIVTDVTTNGTLVFSWRVDNLPAAAWAELVLSALDGDDKVAWSCTHSVTNADAASGWRQFSATVPAVAGMAKLRLQTQAFNNSGIALKNPIFFLDAMRWTVAGTVETPTVDDATTVASLTAGGDGKWGLTAARSDPRFDYVLYGTDDLGKPLSEWRVIERRAGTGSALSFEISADASASARFFMVATEAKQ